MDGFDTDIQVKLTSPYKPKVYKDVRSLNRSELKPYRTEEETAHFWYMLRQGCRKMCVHGPA